MCVCVCVCVCVHVHVHECELVKEQNLRLHGRCGRPKTEHALFWEPVVVFWGPEKNGKKKKEKENQYIENSSKKSEDKWTFTCQIEEC